MLKTKEIVKDWVSRKWHKTHNWKSGTGKFIKKMMNRKERYEGKSK